MLLRFGFKEVICDPHLVWCRGVFGEVDEGCCSLGLSALFAGGSVRSPTAGQKTASSGGLLASLCALKDQHRKLRSKGNAINTISLGSSLN